MSEQFYPGAPRDIDEAARRIHELLFRQQQGIAPPRPQQLSAWAAKADELANILGYDSELVRSAGPDVWPVLEGIASYPNLDRDTQGRLNAAIRGMRESNPELVESMQGTIGNATRYPESLITAMPDSDLLEHKAGLEKVRAYLPAMGLVGPSAYGLNQLGILGPAAATTVGGVASGVGLLGLMAGAGIPMQIRKIEAEMKRRSLDQSGR